MNLPKKLFLLTLAFLFLLVIFPPLVSAQQQGTWQFDPQVTEVGKNAERSRQFIYWVFTHPASYTVPVLVQVWSVSRNIVYALFILVIAITGLGYIIARKNGSTNSFFSGLSSPIFGISLPTLFFRIGLLLIYVTFSYVIVLGLIQTSEIVSRFFIEQFQACRLFNINFTSGTTIECRVGSEDTSVLQILEKNYSDFIGYKDANSLNQESVNTSLFLVRVTTFTYNFLAIVLILRQVVLWFLLMVAPFLAILLPFMFIRNTGYIWIGVFFQWLFYGPLVSLFIAGLSQIWIKGIPYAFNFTRINSQNGQVFPTSINILYGGPAQILSPTNSANYIDTYVEYLVSLIMLWVAILLPWLLLRIFRDYCCDILKQNQGTLLSILDRIRGVGTPPPPPASSGPKGVFRNAVKLPFRKSVEEVNKSSLKQLGNISQANTYELSRSLSLSVNSLAEVARFEMDKKENRQTIETLNRIANPFIVPQSKDREQFSLIKKELEVRAEKGDKEAQQILAAALRRPGVVTPIPVSREFPEITIKEAFNTITQQTNLSTEKVKEIIKEVPRITVQDQVNLLATKLAVSQGQVQGVVDALPQYTPKGVSLTAALTENPLLASEIAKRTNLTEDKTREVIKSFSETTLSQTERVEKIAKETSLSEKQVGSVMKIVSRLVPEVSPQLVQELANQPEAVEKIVKETALTKEIVVKILTKIVELSPERLNFEDQVLLVAEKTKLSQKQVKDVLGTVAATRLEKPEVTKPKAVRHPTVSVEDYEEVKNMWINHYKLSEVPTSETITNRESWLTEDVRVLTNTLDLLTSLNPADKEKGMKEVAQILPFLLLGGFSEVETVVYLKAKLQAAKQVLKQLEEGEKIREEVKKEEEETLVEVPLKEKEKPKTFAPLEATRELPLREKTADRTKEKSVE